MIAKKFAEKYAGQYVTVNHCTDECDGVVIGWYPGVVVLQLGATAVANGYGDDLAALGGAFVQTFPPARITHRPDKYTFASPSFLDLVWPAVAAPNAPKLPDIDEDIPDIKDLTKAGPKHVDEAVESLEAGAPNATIENDNTIHHWIAKQRKIEGGSFDVKFPYIKFFDDGPKEPCPRHYTGDHELSCTCGK